MIKAREHTPVGPALTLCAPDKKRDHHTARYAQFANALEHKENGPITIEPSVYGSFLWRSNPTRWQNTLGSEEFVPLETFALMVLDLGGQLGEYNTIHGGRCGTNIKKRTIGQTVRVTYVLQVRTLLHLSAQVTQPST